MIRKVQKVTVCFLLFALCLPLGGCWNYRGLDKMAIVVGIALDKAPDKENYETTFEILQPAPSQAQSPTVQTTLVSSEGKTLFDAVRNAKKILAPKLYFGNMEIFIISNEIAKDQGLKPVINLMLRDAEPREKMKIIISQEKTAKALLATSGINNKIISQAIKQIIETDNKTVASTKDTSLYQVYNTLAGQGTSLVLPAFHIIENNKQKVTEANGAAIFKKDKLLGYLSPQKTRFYLFAVDEIKGGILPFDLDGDKKDDIAFEISKNKTKRSFSYKKGKVKVNLDITLTVYIDELQTPVKVTGPKEIEKIKKKGQQELIRGITDIIETAQRDFGVDIFGFGTMIYKKDLKLWQKINKNWDAHFQNDLEVTVKPEIIIINTGYWKK